MDMHVGTEHQLHRQQARANGTLVSTASNTLHILVRSGELQEHPRGGLQAEA